MYGIHEDSIARIVFGWIVVLMYIGHVLVLGLGYRAQKRIWRIVGSGAGKIHGEARVVMVRFEEDGTKDDALAKEANVV